MNCRKKPRPTKLESSRLSMSDTGNQATSSWPKVIRDPIHNVITFENTETDQLLFRLVNCREFQRLRRIKQLGLSELVFPGANHSRFAHSIGVMHTARLFLNQIGNAGVTLTNKQKTVVLVSALLHDIGHGPFSHAFEKITRDKHERRTEEIIVNRTRFPGHKFVIMRLPWSSMIV